MRIRAQEACKVERNDRASKLRALFFHEGAMVRPKNYTSFLSWREDESADNRIFELLCAQTEIRSIFQNPDSGRV